MRFQFSAPTFIIKHLVAADMGPKKFVAVENGGFGVVGTELVGEARVRRGNKFEVVSLAEVEGFVSFNHTKHSEKNLSPVSGINFSASGNGTLLIPSAAAMSFKHQSSVWL